MCEHIWTLQPPYSGLADLAQTRPNKKSYCSRHNIREIKACVICMSQKLQNQPNQQVFSPKHMCDIFDFVKIFPFHTWRKSEKLEITPKKKNPWIVFWLCTQFLKIVWNWKHIFAEKLKPAADWKEINQMCVFC